MFTGITYRHRFSVKSLASASVWSPRGRFRLTAYTSFLRHISISTILFACFVVEAGIAQYDNSGVAIVVGENYAYALEAPEEWELDSRHASSMGFGAAFRPLGTTWGKAQSVMYANSVPKPADTVTVEDVINADVKRVKWRTPDVIIKKAPSLETFEGVDAIVQHSTNPDGSLFEAVAYIDSPTAVIMVVLSARTSESFEQSLWAFARLVDSYEWITSDKNEIAELRGMR